MEVSDVMLARTSTTAQSKPAAKSEPTDKTDSFKDTLENKVTESSKPEVQESKNDFEEAAEKAAAEVNNAQVVLVKVQVQDPALQIDLQSTQTIAVETEMMPEMASNHANTETAVSAEDVSAASGLIEGAQSLTTGTEQAEADFSQNLQNNLAGSQTELADETQTAGLDVSVENTEVFTVNQNVKTENTAAALGQTMVMDSAAQTTAASEVEVLPQSPTTEQVIPQIEQKLQNMIKTGENSVNIKIHPENLGQVSIKIVNSADGLQVVLSADKPGTGQLLESGIEQLQEILNSSGVNIGSMSVGYQQPEQSKEDFFENQFSSHGYTATYELEGAELLETASAAGQLASSALDYIA